MGVLSGLEGVFGGPGRGLLTPEQRAEATKESLRSFGLALLAQSGPPGGGRNAPSFLQALAAGTIAGREAYKQSGAEQRKAAATKDIEDILAGGFSGPNLQAAYTRAVQVGDQDTARTLVSAMQTLPEGGTAPNLTSIERDNGDVVFFNPKTGEEVTTWSPPEGSAGVQLAPEDKRIIAQILGQFETATRTMQEVPLQVRRVFGPTNRLIQSYEDPNISEEKKQELAYAAVSAISAYARTIDPGSVVRSEEMQLLLGQGDLRTKLESFLEQKITGRLAVQLAHALQAEARAQLLSQMPVYRERQETTQSLLDRFGYDNIPLPDPYTPLYNELFDKQGRTRVRNTIGLTPEEIEKAGGPAVGGGRANPLQQFIPNGG